MTDLVERLRNPSFLFNHHSDDGFLDEETTVRDMLEAADALEAAQAQAAGVRRATIEECADIARCTFDGRPRIRAGNVDWPDGYDEATRAAEAAIRALTDAAKGSNANG